MRQDSSVVSIRCVITVKLVFLFLTLMINRPACGGLHQSQPVCVTETHRFSSHFLDSRSRSAPNISAFLTFLISTNSPKKFLVCFTSVELQMHWGCGGSLYYLLGARAAAGENYTPLQIPGCLAVVRWNIGLRTLSAHSVGKHGRMVGIKKSVFLLKKKQSSVITATWSCSVTYICPGIFLCSWFHGTDLRHNSTLE